MKKLWQPYAVLIDAWPPRKRAIAFFVAIIGILVLMTLLFIQPSLTAKNLLLARSLQQQKEAQTLQSQIQALEKQRTDPVAVNIARRRALQLQIAAIDDNLKNVQKTLVPAEAMSSILQQVLTANSRLQLISMDTLPVQPLIDKGSKPEAADTAGASANTVFRHGVEVKIQGSYADLHDYLVRLEKLPQRMFWARASLNAEDYPRVVLTVTIYTLNLDKAWLVI